MKKMILSALCSICCYAINAQPTNAIETGISASGEDEETTVAPAAPKSNEKIVYVNNGRLLWYVTMHQQNNGVAFHNLEPITLCKVFVSDNKGNVLLSRAISAKSNVVDFSKMTHGLYFITLINETTDDRKSFSINW